MGVKEPITSGDCSEAKYVAWMRSWFSGASKYARRASAWVGRSSSRTTKARRATFLTSLAMVLSISMANNIYVSSYRETSYAHSIAHNLRYSKCKEDFMGFLSWLFGDDEEKQRQYQKDINDVMRIAYDPEESNMYDGFDEKGMVPHTNPGEDEDSEIDTPPWDDPPDRGRGGFLGWLL